MIQGLKTLSDVNLKGKRVLLRLDLNSDIRSGKLVMSERISAPVETLKELKKKGASVVILAHQGRPGSSDYTNLAQHAKALNKFIKVKYVNDVCGSKAVQEIIALKSGEILLLGNVRSVKDEFSSSTESKLVKTLAPLFDLYVNDAFSASHREHASIVAFPKLLESAIGRVFERELEHVSKLNTGNALFVLGGSKPEDLVLLLEKTRNRVLASGLFGPLCLIASGKKLGKEDKLLKDELKLIDRIRPHLSRIVLPLDLAVSEKGKRVDMSVELFPLAYQVYDIGQETIELFSREIMQADAVFFKGLAGLCNNKSFSLGTNTLLKVLSKTKAFTVVSGGHTLTMLEKLRISRKNFGYVSLSGGALVHFLAYRTLPGIEVLRD